MSDKRKQPKRKRNGEGTIYQLSTTKKWVAQYTYNGKRKSITGKTYEAVKAKLDKVKVEIKERTYIDNNRITVGQILEENLKNKRRSNKTRESTMARDDDTAKIIQNSDLANMPIQQVRRQDIQNFLNDMAEKYSNSSLDKIHILLSGVFKTAVIDEIIHKDFFAMKAINKPKSVKEDKKVDALTREEQQKFVAKLNDVNYKEKYRDVMFFLIEKGVRCGECLALERKDFDLQNKVVHITKTITRDKHGRPKLGKFPKTHAGIRDIPLNDHLIQIFKKNTNFKYLFTHPDGSFIAPSTIYNHVKRVCKDAGIRVCTVQKKKPNGKIVNVKSSDVTTHMLRHTFATRCAEEGMTPKALQAIMGHSDYSITANIYVTADDQFKAEQMQMVEESLKAANLM